jgi:uncharacterized membrane protein
VTEDEQARLDALERRVAELERRLEAADGAPRKAKPAVAASPPPAPRRALETTVGVNWISRIGVVTVILALAFFFEYAFENRWITERGRVLLGLAFAAAALAAGERFWRAGQRAYGQSLAAAGIAFLYLSFWAAFALYGLVPQAVVFVLMALATAAAGYLALRYGSQAVALLGLAGGFATPLLLNTGGEAWFLLGYALMLDAGAVWVAQGRAWRWTEVLAAAGTVLLYANAGAPQPFFALFVAAYFALFAWTHVFAAAEFLAGTALVLVWAPGAAGLAAAVVFAAAGIVVAWKYRSAREPELVAGDIAGSFAGFWLAYMVWHAHAAAPAVGPALLLISLGFLLYPAASLLRAPLGPLELLVLALNAGFFFGAAYDLLYRGHPAFEGLSAVAVAAVYASLARLLRSRDPRGALLAAGAACVLLVLAAPVQLVGYRITMAWAIEAAAAVWIGVRLAERRAVPAAFIVFALVALRLALFDSRMYASHTQYEAVANARFLTFAVAAAAFWAAAWWIRTGRAAQTAYIAGHAVMLWGLCLEAIGWAARVSAPADFRSVSSTALSVLAAGYAVLLVAAGAAWRQAGTRLLGTGLIGLVVLKLYLYDVWLLPPFYRMAAFAILGVLLLVMSYVYSRRARTEPRP